MGKNKEQTAISRIGALAVTVRKSIANVAGAPAAQIQKSRDARFARWDSIYEASRVVAKKYVEELKIEFPEDTSDELMEYMKNQVQETAKTNPNTDFLVDSLTLYVCVALELSGGLEVDVTARRKCMKLIENTRKLNKARKVLKKVETAARIAAAIAALLPDKGKLAPIRKAGVDVSSVIAAKDVLQSELVNAFEKNGIAHPGLQATAKKIIDATSKILEASHAIRNPTSKEL